MSDPDKAWLYSSSNRGKCLSHEESLEGAVILLAILMILAIVRKFSP